MKMKKKPLLEVNMSGLNGRRLVLADLARKAALKAKWKKAEAQDVKRRILTASTMDGIYEILFTEFEFYAV